MPSPTYFGRPDYTHGERLSAAVLLVNLGTPDAPTPSAVRRYLAEFLGDPRVIEVPRLVWLPLLHGVILPFRSRRSAHAYASIWTPEGSPLLVHTRALAEGLQQRLDPEGGALRVAVAMRYGQPSVASVMRRLHAQGVRRLLVLPLYPQYSATTTASVFDAVGRELQTWRWVPELRWVADYADDDGWVEAVAQSIRAAWAAAPRGERLLFSFHGVPQRYLHAGDPYHCQCLASARRIAARLGLADDAWQLSFQSRVGREPWLQPYTDETLLQLARDGVRRVDVVCPGFAVDCLETLEEIALQNAEAFRAAGGETLRYLPALNAQPAHVDVMEGLVRRHAAGWPELAPDAATAWRDGAKAEAARYAACPVRQR